ncbi:MAG: aminotransferase class I/II-fold pyridoxal phosphate-dependent enzyme [Oscillospiraceae bacterium]|nr:aminotransferase class I/II-fold pyridoxal phosphate-dependent enzyme [Oscillospiraceae bacterium]
MKYNFDTTPDHRHNASYRWGMSDMPEDVIGMGTADLDFYCAPCIREALVPIAEDNCYNYRQHTDEYYDAVTSWYRKKYGLAIERDWLTNVPSTIGAVRMALGILAKPGDNVIVQTPVFHPIVSAVEGADLNLIENPMKIVDGHYEIDFDDFEEKIRTYHPAAYLMVNPHNPTCRVFTKEELTKLVDICFKYGVKIVSDEVHCLIVYGDNVHTPILAVSDKAKEISIQIVSLSKGYNIMSMPHAIITVADDEMRAAWNRQIQAFSFGYAVNSFAIAAVTSIMKGEADEWMEELTAYLENNINEFMSFIEKNSLPLTAFRPEGSFLIWVDCRNAGIGEEHLDRFFMDKAHIHLDDGEENFGSEGRGFFRINLAVTNSVLKEALERIKAAFSK